MSRGSLDGPSVVAVVAAAIARRVLLVVSLYLQSAGAIATIPSSERDNLVAIFTQTNGNAWKTQAGWNGPIGTECAWYGVSCDGSNLHVTGISLDANNLTGSLPSLVELPQLDTFVVGSPSNCISSSRNRIDGNLPSLESLPHLVDFEASCNLFSGSLPSLISNTKLGTFYAYGNMLTGTIPTISTLPELAYFDVRDNSLSGNVPELANLQNLVTFDVVGNQLSGPIPTLNGLVKLRYFFVTRNHLVGPIPELRDLQQLVDFYVDDNQLTGSIPPLSQLANLEFLVLGHNALSGVLPDPPPNLLGANVCPNQFPASSYVDSASWDALTQVTPWYLPCDHVFAGDFELGIGVP